MKLSKAFWQTYKESPADAEIPSHKLMIRAGLIHKSGSGLYNYLPMGYKTIRKVENIIREELDKIDCNELLMSVVTPGELWQETGRWDKMGDLMLKFKDKADRDLCISPTNEEAVVDIFRKTTKSYKQLPVSVYQINTKFRDEIRPRFGLMRGREFTMKDAYTFHADKECMDKVYDDFFGAYSSIFTRLGLEFSAVEADGGAIASSDSKTHEFQVIADSGEDAIIYCSETGYAANIEKAETLRPKVDFVKTDAAIEKVSTPEKATIEDVCNFLEVPQYTSLKSLVYVSETEEGEKFHLLMLLGDDTLNEVKLVGLFGTDKVRAATDNELQALKLEKGFIGPVEVNSDLEIIFDKSVDLDCAYVAGANEVDMHIRNVIPSRDIKKFKVADLRESQEGDLTLDGKGVVKVKRGIEVGHIFQLGNKYTEGMDVTVLDNNGKTIHPLMGCYGIGVTRVVAAAIEQNHDENGIIWPASIAPYDLSFIGICKSDEYKELAEKMYGELKDAGFDVLFDDRNAGPGFKFKDADLLGLPIQVVLGERDHKKDGLFEIRVRKSGEKIKVQKDEIISKVKELLKEL
ncbi:proline--tRNA ligase [Halobacteriovorax sp. GB3]|uniref:proline--tRNA ligase n=1 Tax=Halobacteriovorax sp. GB3 TaxID=2719615 RepID=UPI0023628918|nr:proline--tRNA ligase [Halobacteriovorax sp. GB3]MDD0854842.1 proline--tRNA ligase [Halobacteriovorax sp. GB3]